MITLRDYQQEAVKALWKYWREGTGKAPVIVAPTGAGKSIIIAEVVSKIKEVARRPKILMITHVKELIEQNLNELLTLNPELKVDIGICCAGLKRWDTHQSIIFGSIATAKNHGFGKVDLMIVDEAHLIPRRDSSMYGTLIGQLQQSNPNFRLMGLTATPYRLDSGMLHEGEDAIFDGIAYDIGLIKLIKDGYLVKPITKYKGEFKDLKTRAGEYTPQSQADAIELKIPDIIDQIVESTNDLKTLIFLPSVDMAIEVASYLGDRGLECAYVEGNMSIPERDDIINRFKLGELTHLTNCNILTTGSNIPDIECIVLLRATQSPGLYVQMVGRGLRTAPNKKQCLVLDFGGNAIRHGALASPKITDKEVKDIVWVCPECDSINAPHLKICPECGYEKPDPEPKSDDNLEKPKTFSNPFDGDVVGWDIQPHWINVLGTDWSPWPGKNGKPPTVKCSFSVDSGWPVNCWLCPEHTGFARKRYIQWCTKTTPMQIPQDTVSKAVEDMRENWPNAKRINVARKGNSKFMEVLDIEFWKPGEEKEFYYGPDPSDTPIEEFEERNYW